MEKLSVEKKEEIKEKVHKEFNPPPDPKRDKNEIPTLTLASNEDAYIANRMKSQPKTLEDVLTVKEKTYRPGEHRLSLPAELRKFEDRFAFRWINKKKRAIDDAIDVKGWTIVNRALFPMLPPHMFSTSGGIERGDTLLTFMNLKKAEVMRRAPGLKSTARKESNPMIKSELDEIPKGESGLYKPKGTATGVGGVKVNTPDDGSDHDSQRDF